MGGVGSGRRPRVVANGTNGHALPAGPRVTFADLYAKVPPAPAAPPPGALLSGPIAQPSPQLSTTPPAPIPTPPLERAGNRSFAETTAYVAVNLGVTVIGDHLRRRKLEPREVSREDLDRTKETTADAIVRAVGDAEIPWWAGLAAAWGNLYLAMRVGATPLAPAAAITTTTTEPASSATTTPAASPLGQAPPPPRPPPPRDLSASAPSIPLIS